MSQTTVIASALGLLDNPIWNALSTMHSNFAEGDDRAKRYPPTVTPLAATRDQSPGSFYSLAGVLQHGGRAGLFLTAQPLLPPDWTILHTGDLSQMVWNNLVELEEYACEELSNSNIQEMVALAALTQPGPFAARTHELGAYLGIRRNEHLVAMAGERLRLPGYTEISAVCTHPLHRGHGYASSLVSTLIRRITARSEIPFLHVAAENLSAVSVYENLGFKTRRTIKLAVVKRETPP